MASIREDSVFYHLYPLGAFGAPCENDATSVSVHRLPEVMDWIEGMKTLGVDALYLGPVFESERHGYDTTDYMNVDRRLGVNEDLRRVTEALDSHGIALVLDAVFNHVGRRHPFVTDVAANGGNSPYAKWIAGYSETGAKGGLPFSYEGWKGHFDLVKLDTSNDDVREYLIGVALRWIDEFGIAGLRLDAADCLDAEFMRRLGECCRARKPGFFILGEAVHGDGYAPLLKTAGLDAVTNYEAYKSLWSSYNDGNYFEIAWTLDRLFGPAGLVKGSRLYSFADNHDVDRVASTIRDRAGLYPLYALLFSMPGLPSIYYGSEYAIEGRKAQGDDAPLRPRLEPRRLSASGDRDLATAIARFSAARKPLSALVSGTYRGLSVKDRGLAFAREAGADIVIVAVNGSAESMSFEVIDRSLAGVALVDALDPGLRTSADESGRLVITVPPHWARWMAARRK